MSKSRSVTITALLTALALVLHLIESALPPLLPFAPGAKMGLANLASLIALIVVGVPQAYAVLTVRCILGSLFGGNLFSLAYSLPAGLISLTVEAILVKALIKRISIVAVSFTGAVVHNAVQLAVASIIVRTSLLYCLPLMELASAISGLAVGLTAYFALKYLPTKLYITKKKEDTEVK